MRRGLMAAMAAATLLATAPARAQEDGTGQIALGGRLGVTTGGRVTPGGLRLGGLLLHRLSDIDWFEGTLEFTIGAGSAACFRDRQSDFLCNHGSLSGRAGELSAGVRRYLKPVEEFTPFAHARLGLRLLTFPGDDVSGVAIPLTVGGGVRAHINDLVAVTGNVSLEAGVALLNRDLGLEPQLGLTVGGGVELTID